MQEVLQRVHDNGYTHKGIYEGWYCPRCADFKVENEILEGNRCPIHEIVLERHQEENWFFRLSAFQEPLERLFDGQRDFVMPPHHFNEARSFIAQGLQDISLSRKRLKWGVTVPWDPEHVFYVWFDALLNYYTALGYARPGEDLTDRFWPATYHLIGKDILKFHTVFWPAMLMAADLPVPQHVFVHGFLLGADGRKMSKSLGNVLDPFEVDRGVRHRRAALLPDARRVVRRRRRGRDRRGALPLRERAGQRIREPREPDDRDDAPLPRTARFRRWRPTPCWSSEFDGLPRRGRRLLDRARDHPGARADLAAGAAAEPLRRGARAVAARARPGVSGRARRDARVAGRRRAGRERAAAPVHAGEHGAAARCASARREVDYAARVVCRSRVAGAP